MLSKISANKTKELTKKQEEMLRSFPAEAYRIKGRFLCVCFKVEKDENYQTPNQMTQENRIGLLNKFLEELNTRWLKRPQKIIFGLDNAKIVIENNFVVVTPCLLEFDQVIEKDRTRLLFESQGFEYKANFIKYGENWANFVEDVFTAEFGMLESFKVVGNVLVLNNDAPKIMLLDKPKQKKICPQKIAMKKKVRGLRQSLSDEQKTANIHKLEEEIFKIEKENDQLDQEIEQRDEVIRKLEEIYQRILAKH